MRIVEPSDRNFTLFCDVEFGGLSLRAAAQKYQISATRVQQVVEQTRAWYRATTPGWAQQIEPDLQPLVACRLLGDRLEHHYSQAMTAWTDSQGRKCVEREGAHTKVVTTRDCFGEVRYLSQAGRISEACCRAGLRLAKLMDASAVPANSLTATEERATASAVEQIAPPEVGCAREASDRAQEIAEREEPDVATLFDDEVYEQRNAMAPAGSAATLDFPNPVRTRQQRNQRRRELERKRRA